MNPPAPVKAEGKPVTVAVIECSGSWGAMTEAINNPQSKLSPEQREHYRRHFLTPIGDPQGRLHPQVRHCDDPALGGKDHGAAVASRILTEAPDAIILPISTYIGDAPARGVLQEGYDLADAMMDLSQREDVKIINFSAGKIKYTVVGHNEYDENGRSRYATKIENTPKLAEAFRALARAGKVIILAAGNTGEDITPHQFEHSITFKGDSYHTMGDIVEGLDEETLKHVLFVGTLNPDTDLATTYSNKPGNWAKAQERFAFFHCRHRPPYAYLEEGGTSFAAPGVCAKIANYCSKHDVTAREALDAVLATAEQRPERHIYGRGVLRPDIWPEELH